MARSSLGQIGALGQVGEQKFGGWVVCGTGCSPHDHGPEADSKARDDEQLLSRCLQACNDMMRIPKFCCQHDNAVVALSQMTGFIPRGTFKVKLISGTSKSAMASSSCTCRDDCRRKRLCTSETIFIGMHSSPQQQLLRCSACMQTHA